MPHESNGAPRARPVLKWAGGKGQLLSELIARVPSTFDRYFEPFVGGGALFFELASLGRLRHALLSDVNQALVDVYLALRDRVDLVIEELRKHRYEEAYYYGIRDKDASTLDIAARAARVIYLNKTCYNGLYRENRSGRFNVPFGRHRRPAIVDEANLRAAARVLQGVEIRTAPFSEVLAEPRKDDMVYLDPPYHPVSATSRFTAYHHTGFGEADQTRLRDVFDDLTNRGTYAMLSNSDTPLIRQLYSHYGGDRDGDVECVFATRTVNSKADARGKVPELIIRNYPPECTDRSMG
ncbi:MAG: DNA adenine methylase [Chthonomonadales bacterium]|nr:DNA adenine methylase [Chthonomonadales bacterium]